MRILMLCQSPNIKGPLPKHTPLLVAALRALKCEVITKLWGRHSDHESLTNKITVRTQDIIRVRKALRDKDFDVLFVKTAHDWRTLLRDIPLLLATRRLCPVIVLQFHGSFSDRLTAPGYKLFKIASSWLLRLSDAALVLSSEEQRQWEHFYPKGKFFVVSNPFVPLTVHTTESATSVWQYPKGLPVLLFVGRLIPEKGIFDILEALARVRLQIPCHLLIVGSGPEAHRVKEEVVKLGIQDWVTMTGYLKGDQLIEAYQSADVFVLPTYWTEGFPTVIVEAMSTGLPIVTTRIRGAADHLQEDINACFVLPQDTITLSDTLIRLLTDPIKRAKMSKANKEKVKEFEPEKVGQYYLDVFEELVGLQ